MVIKGIRDVVLALVLCVLLVAGHRRALGWVLLVEALAVYGDLSNVLAHHGSVATVLFFREKVPPKRRKPRQRGSRGR
nr:DUF4267 domain-containing protein [Streptomyces sp. 1222.5]